MRGQLAFKGRRMIHSPPQKKDSVYPSLYPGVGAKYGWIKRKCADICDVAQVTDIRILPN